MIEFISSWARQIIIAVIIVTILEMILPNGNSKKYIKTIIGVYILYVIISPAIKLITGKYMEIDYSNYSKYFDTSKEISNNAQGISIHETYKTELIKQMKNDIEKQGYTVNKLNLDLDEEKFIISNLSISISKEIKSSKNKNTINVSINQIEVGNEVLNKASDTEETKNIKQMINENYGVDIKQITISLV